MTETKRRRPAPPPAAPPDDKKPRRPRQPALSPYRVADGPHGQLLYTRPDMNEPRNFKPAGPRPPKGGSSSSNKPKFPKTGQGGRGFGRPDDGPRRSGDRPGRWGGEDGASSDGPGGSRRDGGDRPPKSKPGGWRDGDETQSRGPRRGGFGGGGG
jgi:hypothetical protein